MNPISMDDVQVRRNPWEMGLYAAKSEMFVNLVCNLSCMCEIIRSIKCLLSQCIFYQLLILILTQQ